MSTAVPRSPVLRPLAEVLPGQAPAEPARHEHRDAPDPQDRAPAFAEGVVRAAIEFVSGHRPGRQLGLVLAPHVMTYLTGLRAAAGSLQPQVRVVRCQRPAPGALEVHGLVVLRTGVRAVFARFEAATGPGLQQAAVGRPAHWYCTALHLALTRGDLGTGHRRR